MDFGTRQGETRAMSTHTPRIRFLSLFVDDLPRARRHYAEVLGLQEVDAAGAGVPLPHPYSPGPPAVFELGEVKLALYQVDGRITHTGDVGIGVACGDGAAEVARRVERVGGAVLRRPASEPAASKPAASEPAASEPEASEPAASEPADPLLVFALPDRHFFEVVPPGGHRGGHQPP
jgi:catechol 2,3-dioxygenase-like lactoylglutathione lyase family enzyme